MDKFCGQCAKIEDGRKITSKDNIKRSSGLLST